MSTPPGSSASRPRTTHRWRSRSGSSASTASAARRRRRSPGRSWRHCFVERRTPYPVMAIFDTLINTLFDGRYRVVRKLGSGGMADVYLAEDEELGRRVAIKILNERHANDEQFVERFRREAKNAAGLSHPNIVSIFDRGEAEGTNSIAREYLDGRSRKEMITTPGPAPIPVAVDYARQILAALRVAHRQGLVHRDIKPHNVLVDGEGRVKVTDFGIARAGPSQMTEEGSIIGTAQYLSPEQAQGAPVTPSSDLYSLGIVLYELLTGTVPFAGETPVELAMKHLSKVPEPPSRLRPEVPRDLDLVVMRALAKGPAERYQTADEMDADLARVARDIGLRESVARDAIIRAGLVANIRRRPSSTEPPTFVFDQDPSPGNKTPKGNTVTIFVSTGLAKVGVPDVRNKDSTDAAAAIAGLGLKPDVHQVYSTKDPGTVGAQSPSPGGKAVRAATGTTDGSKGPAEAPVPPTSRT